MHLSVAELKHLRKVVKICFVKNPYIKISKIVEHLKRADFARRTRKNKRQEKTDRRRLLDPTRKHNLRKLANKRPVKR